MENPKTSGSKNDSHYTIISENNLYYKTLFTLGRMANFFSITTVLSRSNTWLACLNPSKVGAFLRFYALSYDVTGLGMLWSTHPKRPVVCRNKNLGILCKRGSQISTALQRQGKEAHGSNSSTTHTTLYSVVLPHC